ncbi:MAG: aldo/keto reductase [Sporolactobacillus sp.]
MINSLGEKVTLNNGVQMPGVGFGTWHVRGRDVITSVSTALKAGYRMIDTAEHYKNEDLVGEAIRKSEMNRHKLFITTKLWNDDQGYEETLKAFDKSLKTLGLDYLDLYLIHWPVTGKFKDSWRAMEHLYRQGKVRAIGVSNFNPHHIEELLEDAKIRPAINQIEFHPLLSQAPLRVYCAEQNIQVEGYSPLGTGTVLKNPSIMNIAEAHDKTAAQVILRWHVQHGIITIPRSTNPEHAISNVDIFDFKLSADEMEKIDALNENRRNNNDPEGF